MNNIDHSALLYCNSTSCLAGKCATPGYEPIMLVEIDALPLSRPYYSRNKTLWHRDNRTENILSHTNLTFNNVYHPRVSNV